jgi:uncharacterized protein
MLIIVPPSETKAAPPADGPVLDLGRLSFPELTSIREEVLDALMETSARPDAFERLHTRPSKAAEVARNTRIRDLATRRVLDVYTGPLHQGLGFATLSPTAADRADDAVVVTSALFGILRPRDHIPPYRLISWASLHGLGRPDHAWRTVLPAVLARAAGPDGVVVELRSPEAQQMGMPADIGDRTVELRVDQRGAGRRIGDVVAKRVRGEAARHLLENDAEPSDPDGLADVLGDRWPVRLEPPTGRSRPWTLTLSVDD